MEAKQTVTINVKELENAFKSYQKAIADTNKVEEIINAITEAINKTNHQSNKFTNFKSINMGYKDVFYRKLFVLLAVIGLLIELFGIFLNIPKVTYFGFFFMTPFLLLTIFVQLMELDMQAGADEWKRNLLKEQAEQLEQEPNDINSHSCS